MSSLDDSFLPLRNLQKRVSDIEERLQGGSLKSGGGDGTSGGMEARVARLESDMEHVKKGVDKANTGIDDLRKTSVGISTTLSTLDERTKHSPTRWDVFLIISGVIAAIGAVVAITARFLPVAG